MSAPQTIADAAVDYHKRGWKPVPTKRGEKKAIGKGWQTRSFDPNQFNGNAQNVAIQFGEASAGLCDVDLDCKQAIGFALDFLPETRAIFGRNGKPASHMLYVTDLHKTEKGATILYRQYQDGRAGPTLVELRIGGNGKGALSVFPPSMHHGETVSWVSDGEPARVAGDDLKRRVLLLAIACLLEPAYPGEGSRHDGALVLGGVLARNGFAANEIEHLIGILARAARDDDVRDRITAATSALEVTKANGSKELPGLPRLAEVWGKDVADTLGRWLNVERAKLAAIGPGGFEDTIALQFAEHHGDDYRFIGETSQWLHWTGERWREERTYAAFDVARGLCRAGGKAGDTRAKTVAGVVTLARTDRKIAARIDQWDRDLDILCAGALTIDLHSGETRPSQRSDYCTKQTTIAPAAPGAPCDLFLQFLDRIFNRDDELIGFLQRFLGYCLTGHVNEHVMAFFYGTGQNGKGTLLRTISGILGNYAVISPAEMFLFAKYDRHPTEVARLRNARLTIAQETPKGRAWDEAKIKNLTGGDPLTGRYMRGDFFDFDPTHKLVIAGNHKPALHSVDEAIRRRFLLIPFTVTIPPAERDPALTEKLKAEWPAILRWMIEGTLEWGQSGLGIAPAVRQASNDYFAAQDDITHWLDECTERKQRCFTPTGALFKSWQQWCVERGGFAGTARTFSEALIEHGLQHKRTEKARGFIDLALKVAGETQMEADLG